MEQVKEGREESLSSYYLRRVQTKIAAGEYATEAVACFCGATDAIPVAERDRYGLDYQMGICRRCGVMYANPRMTEAAYAQFYSNEYRQIYDTEKETAESDFKNGLKLGASLAELLEHFEIAPKVVFDIGCNAGAMLTPFHAAGAATYGVDYDGRRTDYGRAQGLHLFTGGMEALEALGVKADLIILNHVLEHFLDLRASLARIRALLAPNGALFVGVPGLYATQRELIFQSAHTYQFTGQTLAYVMGVCGFSEVYLDEYVTSIWRTGEARSESDTPKEIPMIVNYLFEEKRKVPFFRTVNKFPLASRRENIQKALSHRFPDIEPILESRSGAAVIIGGGPSVNGQIDKIRQLIDDGAAVISIERMYQFCLDNEIIPDYVVALDASDDVVESFGRIHPGVTHLVSAQCHPGIFDLMEGKRVHIFNTPQAGIEISDYWDKYGYNAATVLNSGGSVTLCAMSAGMALGFRDFRIFGFDCHITEGNYAQGITGVGAISHVYEVEIDGRIFKTTSSYLSFAQQFFLLAQGGRDFGKLDSVKIYGDSMIPFMSKNEIGG